MATTGSDDNSGDSPTNPFRTIQKAAMVASAGDVVNIRQGIYDETVTPAHSGLPGRSIVFQSYQGEAVTLSGADPVSGWKPYAGDRSDSPDYNRQTDGGPLYETILPWSMNIQEHDDNDQIFVDGLMMNEARFPNSGFEISLPNLLSAKYGRVIDQQEYTDPNTGKSVKLWTKGEITDEPIIRSDNYWVGSTFHGIGGKGYGNGQTNIVIASEHDKITFSLSEPIIVGKQTYYGPQTGSNYYLTGRFSELNCGGEWFHDVRTKRLYLWTPTGLNPQSERVEARKRTSAFVLSGLSFIKVEGLDFFASTIITDELSHDNILDHLDFVYPTHFNWINNFYEKGQNDSGVLLNGYNNVLQYSSIAFSAGNGVTVLGTKNKVIGCLIHDCSYVGSDCAGIGTGFHTKVISAELAGNTIYNCSRALIQIRSLYAGYIHHNNLWNGMLHTKDYGAIYALNRDGGGTRISYNRIHDMRPPNNYKNASNGIYLDNGTNNYIIDHNIVWGAYAAFLPNARYAGGFHRLLVYNNTFLGDNASIGYSINPDPQSTFRNNIFYNRCPTLYSSLGFNHDPSLVQDHNLFNVELKQDPQFFDFSNHDYRCRADIALNGGVPIRLTDGTAITAPGVDNPDIGAFDHREKTWIAGAEAISKGILANCWTFRDLGVDHTTSVIGHTALIGDHFYMTAGGSGLDEIHDSFHFLSTYTDGSQSILARLIYEDSDKAVNPTSEAGVILRASDSTDDRFAYASLTSGGNFSLKWREKKGGPSERIDIVGGRFPVWLKLVPGSLSVLAFYSFDGYDWRIIGQAPVYSKGLSLAGLAATSNNPQLLMTSVFSNCTILPSNHSL